MNLKCEVAGLVCQYAWEIRASFGLRSHSHYHAKLIICLLFYVLMNLSAVKKKKKRKNFLCFIEIKLWHNVTFAISTESVHAN